MYKLVFYVPESHLEHVKQAIFAVGGGLYEGYDQCCWQVAGTGQFRPLAGSNPFLGEIAQVNTVDEFKVEMICSDEIIVNATEALIKTHPYEQPAYQIIAFLSLHDLVSPSVSLELNP